MATNVRTNNAVWLEKYNRWQLKVQANGIRKTFSSSTPGPAGQKKANKAADDWLRHQLINENSYCRDIFDNMIEDLKVNTSKGNWQPIKCNWDNWIAPIIGRKRVGKVTEQDCKDVITAANKAGKTKKTLKNIRFALVTFLQYARSCNATTLRPEKLPIPSTAVEGEEKQPIQPDDIRKLFTSTKTTWRNKVVDDWYIHMYRYIVATGLRPGEAIALDPRYVYSREKTEVKASINRYNERTSGKTKKARRAYKSGPIISKILDDQRDMLKRAGIISRYVFPAPSGDHARTETIEKNWRRYREYNNIADRTPYEMRHTFISLIKDMPEALKKLIVGHTASMDTDGTYSHEMDGDLDRAAQIVEDALRGVLGELF